MNIFTAQKLVAACDLSLNAKSVYLNLAFRCGKERNACWPSLKTIAKDVGVSVSTVQRALRELLQIGLLKKEARTRAGNQGQTSNLYVLKECLPCKTKTKELDRAPKEGQEKHEQTELLIECSTITSDQQKDIRSEKNKVLQAGGMIFQQIRSVFGIFDSEKQLGMCSRKLNFSHLTRGASQCDQPRSISGEMIHPKRKDIRKYMDGNKPISMIECSHKDPM